MLSLSSLRVENLPFRILSRVEIVPEVEGGHWLWLGSLSGGYGQVGRTNHLVPGTTSTRVHVAVYELTVGPVPLGKELDHVCKIKHCCYPGHVEPVTHQENNRRAHADKRLCNAGHPLDGRRSNGHRYCLTCNRIRTKASRT